MSAPRDPAGPRAALDALTRALESDDDVPRPATFVRGLTLGALVGAAIAGSALWSRRQRLRSRTHEPDEPPSVEPPAQ